MSSSEMPYAQSGNAATSRSPTPSSAFDPPTEFLNLPDGRKLAFSQWGTPTGKPVIWCHGFPGSRYEGAHLHGLGLKLGARLIVPDRPGFGASTPHPSRTLLDHPKDLEKLADHLKLEKYGVFGASGGGPYALACAYSLPPEKLKAVTVVCGMGPVSEIGMKGAAFLHWVAFGFGYRITPPFVNKMFWQTQTCGRVDLTDEQRLERHMAEVEKAKPKTHPKEIGFNSDPDNARRFLKATKEAFAQGYDPSLQDAKIISRPWGFRIEDIRKDLPVFVWHGSEDVFVPTHHGETVAKRLGSQAKLHIEEETHGSIFSNCRESFLKELVDAI